MMLSRIALTSFLLPALLGTFACSRPHGRVIGVVSKGQAHEFWQSIHAGAIAAGRDFGVQILWNGPAQETDVNRQIQIVESMIARRVSAIALAPVEQNALVSYVNQAVSAGIPVTIYDSGLASQNYLSFVATNNYQAGVNAARKLASLIGGKGDILELKHMPGSASSMEREQAFGDTLTKEFPKIHVVGEQYGMADRGKCLAAAEDLLTAHPNAKAFFASAESSSAGVVRAVESRGLAGKIVIVAFDSSPELVSALQRGTITALVVQDPFRIGYEAVKTLVDELNHKQPPRRIDLDARVITKSDLARPDVHSILFPDLAKYLN